MEKTDCFYFGKVIKTHGIKGEISIRIDADDPNHYREIQLLLIELGKKLIPFFPQFIKINTNKAYVKLQDVDSIEKAAELAGADIYLPLELLPKLRGNKFYFHEVPGFKVHDDEFGPVGLIEKVLEYPSQSVFQVIRENKEILIPIHDEIILKVDRKAKIIFVKAPEGLIEMYLRS